MRPALATVAAVVLALAAGIAQAQDYPNKPIRMIVPYPPGGGTDVVARILNEKLSPELGQPIVIDNKGGAGGSVGTELASKTAPDGYTILLTLSSHTINPEALPEARLRRRARLHPGEPRRVDPADPGRESVGAREQRRGADRARSRRNPGKFNYASVGIGSPGHIAGELFKLRTGVQMTHVPYKGGGPAVTDTIGGQVQLLFVSMPAALAVREGRAREGARGDKRKRSASAPDVPTIAEKAASTSSSTRGTACWCPRRRRRRRREAQRGDGQGARHARRQARSSSRRARRPCRARRPSSTRSSSDELRKWEFVIREAKITPE